ncbi:MAG: pyridoxamine 5'-phosphate oxidase [Bdellovibrionales bacterium]|nr:pyridoxamine 5'-phosphate oxidase [Bdellovibrionales bacterium]
MKVFSTWREGVFLLLHPALWFRRELLDEDLCENPFDQFAIWYRAAERQWWGEFPNWCCLSTLDGDGYPEGRIVLMKNFSSEGFVFYTNRSSRKGISLIRDPRGSMTFFWERLQRQVRIVGDVLPASEEDSDDYFRSRPRKSQIGAWASLQSEELPSRQHLQRRMEEYARKFQGMEVPRPPHWGGFCLVPRRFEFWELRLNRLHDRFEYTQIERGLLWNRRRLYP